METNKENLDPERVGRSILKHEDRTMPLMSTTRLDGSVKLAKRRVSFAPEVTLHKIDFIPQYLSRRETIGPIPSSQDGSEPEQPHGQQILDDSSDESDVDTNQQDEFTMDFTDQMPSSINGDAQKTTKPQQEPLGNTVHAGELDMELTQSFPKVHVDMMYPQTHNIKSHISVQTVADEEEMEFTQSLPKINIQSVTEEPMEPTESLSGFASTHEQPMELTQPLSGIQDYTPTDNLSTIEPFTHEEIMELTQSLSNIKSSVHAIPPPTEEAMELTQSASCIHSTETSIPVLIHPEQLQPDLFDEVETEITQSIANIRMQSPEQPARYECISRESLVEPQFPEIEVPIPDLGSDSRKRSGDFDDTESNKLLKIQPIQSTTTIPLPDMTNESFEFDNDHVSVSLSDFLKDLGIRFYDDLEIDNSSFKRFSITDSLEDKQIQFLDFIIAANKIPLWSLFNFSNTELSKNIREGKKLYTQLNETILANNPKLFKEFYASDLTNQLQLKGEFLLIKEFSRFQAKKVWYNWRSQLVENLILQLEERIEAIKVDMATFDETARLLQLTIKENSDKAQSLRLKLNRIRRFRLITEDCSSNDIQTFKKDMMDFKEKSKALIEDIRAKRAKLQEANTNIDNNTSKIDQLKNEIQEKKAFLDENKKYEMTDIKLMNMKFKLFLKLTNMSFKLLDQECLCFVFDKRIELKVFYESSRFSITPLNLHVFVNEWLINLATDQTLYKQSNDLYTNFRLFKQRYETLKRIDRDISAINLRFPVTRPPTGSDSMDFAVQYYNFDDGQKINFKFMVDKKQIALHQLKFNISAQIIKNKDDTINEENILSFLRSKCQSPTLLAAITLCIIVI